MRTTVTLDNDVEHLLREAMHRSRKSFKHTLNQAVRRALAPGKKSRGKRFVVRARALGLRPGIDPTSFNKMADEIEAEAFVNSRKRVAK